MKRLIPKILNNKLRKRIIIILVSIISVICFLNIGGRVMHKIVVNMSTMKEGVKYYCYYNESDTNKVYGVSSLTATKWSKKIDAMLSYYDYKFKGLPYEFSDISFIRSIQNNQKVTVQEYIRDSSVVLVAYPDTNKIRNTVMPMKLYVPEYILHKDSRIKKPIEGITGANNLE